MRFRLTNIVLLMILTPNVALAGMCIDQLTGMPFPCYAIPPPPPDANRALKANMRLQKQIQITQRNDEILKQKLQQEQQRQEEVQQAQMDRQRELQAAHMAPILAARQAQIDLQNEQRQARFDTEHTNCKKSYATVLRSLHLRKTSVMGICKSDKATYEQCPPCN